MKQSVRDLQKLGDKVANAVLFAFGKRRERIEPWPPGQLDRLLAQIKQRGGRFEGEKIPHLLIQELRFRLGKGRITISIVDDDEIFLLGPKKLVRELVVQIAA